MQDIKLLLDANISWKLLGILKPVYGGCSHVDLIGIDVPAKDTAIWEYARDNGYIIVTKDNDFLDLLESNGFPPKVVLVKIGNSHSKVLAELIINAKPMIEDLEHSNYGLLELIN
jgi:predicted nuclease of predicted toxin-antitoxin system